MEYIPNGERFTYEQFVAGALLRFDCIDNIDISLLMQKITRKLDIQFTGTWSTCFRNSELASSIEYDSDSVGFSLSKQKRSGVITEAERDYLNKKLERAAGETIVNYFRSLHMPSYRAERRKNIKGYSISALQNARVLLISNFEGDYNILKKQGFNNINWIQSGNVAKDFFAQKPNLLGKHDIVIINSACTLEKNKSEFNITDIINELAKRKRIALIKIDRSVYSYTREVSIWITDSTTNRSKLIKAKDVSDIVKAIEECAITNHLLDHPTNFNSFVSIENYNLTPFQKEFELYEGMEKIGEILQYLLERKKQREAIISLPNQYYILRQSDGSIYIRGIYDGQARVVPIYIQDDGRYTTLKHTNVKMAALFVKEVLEMLTTYNQDKQKQMHN